MYKRVLFGFIFIFCSVFVFALGGREKPAANPVVQVTGIVRLTGTSIFPEIVVTNSDGEWHIAADERIKLNDLQHSIVTVEGIETITEQFFASGLSAGIRRTLSDIRVISVRQSPPGS